MVISNDSEWRALTKKAGWEFPILYGIDKERIKSLTERLKSTIISDGHDALVIKMNQEGDYAKTLRNMFGHDQVVLYNPTEKEATTISDKLEDELGKLTPAKTDIKAENWLDTVKEEDLDSATAEGAYRWISFDADKRAKIVQKDYVAEMKRGIYYPTLIETYKC